MQPATLARGVSRAKAERLVANARFLAFLICVVAAAVTVSQGHGWVPLLVTLPWCAVSAVLAWIARRRVRPRTPAFLLVVDLVVIFAVIITTGGVGSPFFAFLILPVFAASILYGKRAMLWSAAAGIVVLVTISLTTARTSIDPRLFIIRVGLLLVIGTMMTRRVDYEQRIQHDMENLATWPRDPSGDRKSVIRQILARAATVLRTRRAALVWRENDGSSWLAQIDGDRFDAGEEELETLVAPGLEQASAFLLGNHEEALRSISGAIEAWSGPVLSPALAQRLDAGFVIGARLASETVSGWLLLLDHRDADADDLMLAEVVARLVSSGLDQINLAEMVREGAAAEERMRLSRDLHDGLLQSLGGLALHAQGARRAVETDPAGAKERLEIVVEQLTEGQRMVRDFVDELRPELSLRREPLHARLGRLAETVARHWDVRVEVSAAREIDAIDGRLAEEIAALLAEALTNAAKHAGASLIRGAVSVDGTSVIVAAEDDGRGFPFIGRYELPQLVADRCGPWSLKERVAALDGEMVIDSSARGSRVEVRLPVW